MVTDDILVYPTLRRRPLTEAERRRLAMRDTIAWILVGLIHVGIFFSLVISLQQARREREGRQGTVERIFDLTMLRQKRVIPLNIAPPEPNEDRDISAKPLTVTPPKTPVFEVAPPPATNTPGDVLNSIGWYLACGASIFEYLNPQQQARCLHQPWQGWELPNGVIVLAPPTTQAGPGQMQFTGADTLRRQSQQAPNCPVMINTPCLADMFNDVGH